MLLCFCVLITDSGKPLPPSLSALREGSPFKWGCEALLAAEFVGKELSKNALADSEKQQSKDFI